MFASKETRKLLSTRSRLLARVASFHSSSVRCDEDTREKNWQDPAARQYKFWNREKDASTAGKYQFLIEMSPESVQREARILSLSDPEDPANQSLHSGENLPLGASVVGVGTKVSDFANAN